MPNRTDLLRSLREATNGDLWLTTYALFRLTEEVDLGALNGLMEAVLSMEEQRAEVPTGLSGLLYERYGLAGRER